MTLYEAMFLGACVGWVIAALCFLFIPSWKATLDIVPMDDEALVKLMVECGNEWTYRHPEMRAEYEKCLQAGVLWMDVPSPPKSDDTA